MYKNLGMVSSATGKIQKTKPDQLKLYFPFPYKSNLLTVTKINIYE